jgi:hypothetical protein
MYKIFSTILLVAFLAFCPMSVVSAQTEMPLETGFDEATTSGIVIIKEEPTPVPRPDLTSETKESVEPLKKLLDEQALGPRTVFNAIKYALRDSIDAGVPPNTVVLLLLLPGVAALIAAARHLIGLRGFGIFLPAALSIVFMATGPVVGIVVFLVIVAISTVTRITMRRLKIKLQYLPRMALLLHFVVLGILAILFLTPYIGRSDFAKVSIFPVLFMVLLAEDFTKVQLGKSAKVAFNLAFETLILALISYIFLNLKIVQEFVLLHPESWIVLIILIDYALGKYVGLRFIEYWRFRTLIKN